MVMQRRMKLEGAVTCCVKVQKKLTVISQRHFVTYTSTLTEFIVIRLKKCHYHLITDGLHASVCLHM